MAYHAIQPVPLTRRQRWGFVAALVALAIAASWTGVFNGYTYDDRFIVLNNIAMHDLRNWWKFFGMPYWPAQWGSDGYRPLTILAYSLEWTAGHGKPWIFHAVNIALYAGVSVSVFFLAETCLPFAAAFAAAALYAVHPVHVEAVGNVVGQSELLVAIFIIPAITIYIRRRNANQLTAGAMIAICLLYVAACLAKEHGFMLPGLLFVAELIVVVDKAPFKARLAALRPFGLGLALVAVGYLWAHVRINHEITGFHPYVPFGVLGLGAWGRVWTMIGLVPEWIRLFLWPMRLTAEYGPPAFPVVNGFEAYQIPGLIALVGIIALSVATWHRAPAVSFGIWFLVLTLLPSSNFIVPSGLLLAERTLLMPSVGAMIAFAAVVPWLYAKALTVSVRAAATAAFLAILAVFGWRSMQRTKVWKDNDSLFSSVVIDAPNVYRSHFMLGAWDFSQNRKIKGEREYITAMQLYDQDPYVYYSLGEEYRGWAMYKPAIVMFRKALEVDTTMYEARARLALSLADLGRWSEADQEALRALRENTLSTKAMLGVIRLASESRTKAARGDSGKVGLVGGLAADSSKVHGVPQKAIANTPVSGSGKSAKPPVLQ